MLRSVRQCCRMQPPWREHFCRKTAPRQHPFPIETLQCRVTATSPFDTDDAMDVLVTHPKHGADSAFDTARIAAAVEALAEKHAGREDMFRSAVAQLLKAE